eukprot:CAMPEP_0180804314 /NCGR_PEP_ID=MMETSP1038_2-20121128/61392_1 /TAXON_ID=632150 /ORGANISM="Azadinium spinosum, Strain 3D9" /LENGTH=58 /DNA_ID=CAMNT_0022844743 /DNA_START=336 /DNA_END=509 /DNA_ORIENTATION=-
MTYLLFETLDMVEHDEIRNPYLPDAHGSHGHAAKFSTIPVKPRIKPSRPQPHCKGRDA